MDLENMSRDELIAEAWRVFCQLTDEQLAEVMKELERGGNSEDQA